MNNFIYLLNIIKNVHVSRSRGYATYTTNRSTICCHLSRKVFDHLVKILKILCPFAMKFTFKGIYSEEKLSNSKKYWCKKTFIAILHKISKEWKQNLNNVEMLSKLLYMPKVKSNRNTLNSIRKIKWYENAYKIVSKKWWITKLKLWTKYLLSIFF